jgi:hypothetical protein
VASVAATRYFDISTIRDIVDAVNVPTVKEFLENVVRKRFMPHMSRTVFTLCVTAFDSFVGRHGSSGTLGKKFVSVWFPPYLQSVSNSR